MSQKFFWRGLWQLLKPYWTSNEKWLAMSLLGLVITCEVGQVQLMVMLNNWNKGFYDALQAFDKSLLASFMLQFAAMVAAFVVVVGYSGYFSGLLVNRWRRWLTQHYQHYWIMDKQYYALQIHNKSIDNPDQRISEDLNEFPMLSLSLFTGFFSAMLTLVSFGVILWHLSGSFRLPYIDRVIPGYMFWGALLFSIFGTWITFKIGSKLANLNYAQERYNANFRFRLIRIRESAEQIAFYQGEHDENSKLNQSFNYIYENALKIIKLRKYLSFFNVAYLNFANLGGTLLALPRFLAEKLALGILIQTAHAFKSVHESLSFIVLSYPTIASWRAVIHRLTEFNERMCEARFAEQATRVVINRHQQGILQLQQLNIQLPTGVTLLKGINLTLQQGEKLLIQGASGSGKSTLLRAIAGLWPFGEGEIYLPAQQNLMFLPQKPYLPLGTLASILAYPGNSSHFTDEQFINVLTCCNLARLIPCLTEEANWSHVLSLGEQQRIAFARLLLHKPDWIFLDEATSALDEPHETMLYQLLLQQLPNATWISIGHRRSLIALHERNITITDYQ